MKKIIRLTEEQLHSKIQKVLNEQVPPLKSVPNLMSQFNQAITTIQTIMVKFGYKQPVTGKLDDATIIGLQTILNKLKSQTQAKPPTVAKPQMQNPPPPRRTGPRTNNPILTAPPPRTNIN
jgi:hypothetical protein